MTAVMFLLAVLVVFAVKRKKRKPNGLPATPADGEDFRTDTEAPKKRNYYDTFRKSILFLDGFQVFNKEGKNITGEFTPTLKYLLVLIVLYTLKNNKGISSSRLQELLWYDKTKVAARNNRSVNLRKLRVLLAELGSIDITSQNGYWTISLPDDVLSDYWEVLRLAGEIQNSTITRKEDLLRFLELLNYGSLLPNIQLEWVDDFKTDFSNLVIDTLMQVINNTRNAFYDQPDIRLKIAAALLKIDSINEEAISIKCQALVRMGKKGLAKTAFDNFNKEYKLLLGENFSGSIKSFLE
jgi:two-component SAPR family response regulator